ncbi:hypothetical protein MRY87_03465 [bacterium]|nr:hypothetical protein [bacterium]
MDAQHVGTEEVGKAGSSAEEVLEALERTLRSSERVELACDFVAKRISNVGSAGGEVEARTLLQLEQLNEMNSVPDRILACEVVARSFAQPELRGGRENAIALLGELCRDKEHGGVAARALCRLAGTNLPLSVRTAALEQLLENFSSATPFLSQELASATTPLREAVAVVLASRGESGEALVAVMQVITDRETSMDHSVAALRAHVLHFGADAVPALIAAVSADGVPKRFQRVAVAAVLLLGGREGVASLRTCEELDDVSWKDQVKEETASLLRGLSHRVEEAAPEGEGRAQMEEEVARIGFRETAGTVRLLREVCEGERFEDREWLMLPILSMALGVKGVPEIEKRLSSESVTPEEATAFGKALLQSGSEAAARRLVALAVGDDSPCSLEVKEALGRVLLEQPVAGERNVFHRFPQILDEYSAELLELVTEGLRTTVVDIVEDPNTEQWRVLGGTLDELFLLLRHVVRERPQEVLETLHVVFAVVANDNVRQSLERRLNDFSERIPALATVLVESGVLEVLDLFSLYTEDGSSGSEERSERVFETNLRARNGFRGVIHHLLPDHFMRAVFSSGSLPSVLEDKMISAVIGRLDYAIREGRPLRDGIGRVIDDLFSSEQVSEAGKKTLFYLLMEAGGIGVVRCVPLLNKNLLSAETLYLQTLQIQAGDDRAAAQRLLLEGIGARKDSSAPHLQEILRLAEREMEGDAFDKGFDIRRAAFQALLAGAQAPSPRGDSALAAVCDPLVSPHDYSPAVAEYAAKRVFAEKRGQHRLWECAIQDDLLSPVMLVEHRERFGKGDRAVVRMLTGSKVVGEYFDQLAEQGDGGMVAQYLNLLLPLARQNFGVAHGSTGRALDAVVSIEDDDAEQLVIEYVAAEQIGNQDRISLQRTFWRLSESEHFAAAIEEALREGTLHRFVPSRIQAEKLCERNNVHIATKGRLLDAVARGALDSYGSDIALKAIRALGSIPFEAGEEILVKLVDDGVYPFAAIRALSARGREGRKRIGDRIASLSEEAFRPGGEGEALVFFLTEQENGRFTLVEYLSRETEENQVAVAEAFFRQQRDLTVEARRMVNDAENQGVRYLAVRELDDGDDAELLVRLAHEEAAPSPEGEPISFLATRKFLSALKRFQKRTGDLLFRRISQLFRAESGEGFVGTPEARVNYLRVLTSYRDTFSSADQVYYNSLLREELRCFLEDEESVRSEAERMFSQM